MSDEKKEVGFEIMDTVEPQDAATLDSMIENEERDLLECFGSFRNVMAAVSTHPERESMDLARHVNYVGLLRVLRRVMRENETLRASTK